MYINYDMGDVESYILDIWATHPIFIVVVE